MLPFPKGPIGPAPILRTLIGDEVLITFAERDPKALLRATFCLVSAYHRPGDRAHPLVVQTHRHGEWIEFARLPYCERCASYQFAGHCCAPMGVREHSDP